MQNPIQSNLCFVHYGHFSNSVPHCSHLTCSFTEPQVLDRTDKQDTQMDAKAERNLPALTREKQNNQKGWHVAMVTYWGVSVGSAWAGMGAYLIGLCGAACGPNKLHDGHKHSNDQTTDQHHEDAPDVLHAQTCAGPTRDKHQRAGAGTRRHWHCFKCFTLLCCMYKSRRVLRNLGRTRLKSFDGTGKALYQHNVPGNTLFALLQRVK